MTRSSKRSNKVDFSDPEFCFTGPEQSMEIDDRKINRSIDDNRLITVD